MDIISGLRCNFRIFFQYFSKVIHINRFCSEAPRVMVEPDNYDALYACVSNQAVGAAKLLLDRGIDREQYQLWAEHRPKGDGYTETMEELAAYWSELQNSTQPEDSPMKGMNL